MGKLLIFIDPILGELPSNNIFLEHDIHLSKGTIFGFGEAEVCRYSQECTSSPEECLKDVSWIHTYLVR